MGLIWMGVCKPLTHTIAGASECKADEGRLHDARQTTHNTHRHQNKARGSVGRFTPTPHPHPHHPTNILSLFFFEGIWQRPVPELSGLEFRESTGLCHHHHHLKNTIRTHNSIICRHCNPQHSSPATHNIGTRDIDLAFAFDAIGQSVYLQWPTWWLHPPEYGGGAVA